MHCNFPNTFNLEFPGLYIFLSDLIKVCPFIPSKSLSKTTATSAPVSILKLSYVLLIHNFFVQALLNLQSIVERNLSSCSSTTVTDLTDLLVAQHFAKCPMYEHLNHFTPFAGKLSLESLFWQCPHLKHPAP